MKEEVSISVQLINYNTAVETIECVESLLNSGFKNFDILVIDNGSNNNEKKLLIDRLNNKVELLLNERNIGFAQAHSVALEYRRKKKNYDFHLIINNDVTVSKGFIYPLLQAFELFQNVGISGPKILLSGTNLLDSAGSIFTNTAYAYSRGNCEYDEGQYNKPEIVPMITACCMLVADEVFEKTYLFDPKFFMYLEELDFNLRVRNFGYQIVYMPTSIVYHKYSSSVKKTIRDQKLLNFYKHLYAEANRTRILLKHFPLSELIRNVHLISLNYLYWELKIIRFCGLKWFKKLNQHIFDAIIDGFRSRKIEKQHKMAKWLPYMERLTLAEYLERAKRAEKKWAKNQ
ncbi:MAG: glycosyltransferase family 2 protein [Methanomassiliicoccales archaeon]|nr:glycosyltransferase family 2 protein [Methanomassiliicoccales archaeon]